MNALPATPPPMGYDGPMSVHRRWLATYAAVLVAGFAVLYAVTRSSILVGDARQYIEDARVGDPAAFHYGNLSHFLQIPLSRAIWRGFGALGVPVSLEGIVVALAFMGTLAAIVFVGLIAAEMTRTRGAAWLGAILFGTSLHVWTQVNGEQYGLALGFVTAGLWLALRGRLGVSAICWALAMTAHSEFVMAGPAFVMAVWIARPGPVSTRTTLRRVAVLVALAALLTVVILLVWSRAIGKWSTPESLVAWIRYIYVIDHKYATSGPEVFRAIKGLVTALTVAGHFWRDILTSRGVLSNPVFAVEAGIGLLVLLLTGVFLAAAASTRRLFLFGLTWLLPFHVLGNWWFQPTVEKYHAGALPGFVLLVTGGLVQIAARRLRRKRHWLIAGYLGTCAGLNLVGAVLPIQALGRARLQAEQQIRQLNDARGGRAVFVACDATVALVSARVQYFRLRSFWFGTIPEIQARVIAWIEARVAAGDEPYLVDRWCHPDEWLTKWSQAPFDLYFLERSYRLTPTGITGIPIGEPSPTNPFSWTRGDIVRLEPRSRPQ